MHQYVAVRCKSCRDLIVLADVGAPGSFTLDHPTVPYAASCICGAEHTYSLRDDVVTIGSNRRLLYGQDRLAWFRPAL